MTQAKGSTPKRKKSFTIGSVGKSSLSPYVLRILIYDELRNVKSPEAILLDFLQTTYQAAANLAKWDRKSL